MKGMGYHYVLAVFLFGICITITAAQENDPNQAALAKESEEACKASAKYKPTPELIIKKVNEACKLLEKEGDAAFPKFSGKKSDFIFGGTYMAIHDMNGVVIMNPIKYKLVGKHLIKLRDANGVFIIREMIKIAREKGSGWLAYVWPKPGEYKPSPKVTYVKAVKIDGIDMVIQCGIYDLPKKTMKELVQEKK